MGPQKALETIGANLQKQYENWQPRVSIPGASPVSCRRGAPPGLVLSSIESNCIAVLGHSVWQQWLLPSSIRVNKFLQAVKLSRSLAGVSLGWCLIQSCLGYLF